MLQLTADIWVKGDGSCGRHSASPAALVCLDKNISNQKHASLEQEEATHFWLSHLFTRILNLEKKYIIITWHMIQSLVKTQLTWQWLRLMWANGTCWEKAKARQAVTGIDNCLMLVSSSLLSSFATQLYRPHLYFTVGYCKRASSFDSPPSPHSEFIGFLCTPANQNKSHGKNFSFHPVLHYGNK